MACPGGFVRRPVMDEIAVVSVPDPVAAVYPAMDLYDAITVPAGFVLASGGLYGNREADLQRVVAARPNRHVLKCECGHNVHMQKPAEVAAFIRSTFL